MTALIGTVTQNISEIIGPRNAARAFPLTLDQYLDKMKSLGGNVARVLFNAWPSSAGRQENVRDPKFAPADWPPFSYDQATLPLAWVAGERITTIGARRLVTLTSSNGPLQLVYQCSTLGVTGNVAPALVNGNGDGTTSDGEVQWTVVNATVLTDSDWAAWTARVLYPAIDGVLARGFNAIICLNDFGDPVDNPTLQARHLSFWGRVAVSKYANDPRVAFENHGEIIRSGPGVWAGIRPLFQATLDLIRKTASNLFITSTPGFCGSPLDAMADPLIGRDIAYAYHTYFFNTPLDMVYAREQMSGSLPVAVTEWGDNGAIRVFYNTYDVGAVINEGGIWYECVGSVKPESASPWAAGPTALGQISSRDAAAWECIAAGLSTTPPSGNTSNNPAGMDHVTPDGTGPGVAKWRCISCRDRVPATSPTFWQPTTKRSAWFKAFTALLEELKPIVSTAWAVSFNWAPGIFSDLNLSQLSGWGFELVPWLGTAGTTPASPPIGVPPVPTPQTASPTLDLIPTPATSTDPIILTVHLAVVPPPVAVPPPPTPAQNAAAVILAQAQADQAAAQLRVTNAQLVVDALK